MSINEYDWSPINIHQIPSIGIFILKLYLLSPHTALTVVTFPLYINWDWLCSFVHVLYSFNLILEAFYSSMATKLTAFTHYFIHLNQWWPHARFSSFQVNYFVNYLKKRASVVDLPGRNQLWFFKVFDIAAVSETWSVARL